MNRRAFSLGFTFLICLPISNETGAARTDAGGGQVISSQLIGDWQSEKFGTQTLTAYADGTAELKMHLNTMAAVLYGREITLLLKWTFDGNCLTQCVVGGSPERSVDKLTRKYGKTYCYRIVELTGSQLIVEDTSTGKTCCWDALQAGSQTR